MTRLSDERLAVIGLLPEKLRFHGRFAPETEDQMRHRKYQEREDAADAIDALLAELKELRAEREWRPIETAPKDGTEILLRGIVTYPSIDEGKRVTVIGYWADMNGGGWVWYGATTNFTHWRPLPEPPATEEQSDD